MFSQQKVEDINKHSGDMRQTLSELVIKPKQFQRYSECGKIVDNLEQLQLLKEKLSLLPLDQQLLQTKQSLNYSESCEPSTYRESCPELISSRLGSQLDTSNRVQQIRIENNQAIYSLPANYQKSSLNPFTQSHEEMTLRDPVFENLFESNPPHTSSQQSMNKSQDLQRISQNVGVNEYKNHKEYIEENSELLINAYLEENPNPLTEQQMESFYSNTHVSETPQFMSGNFDQKYKNFSTSFMRSQKLQQRQANEDYESESDQSITPKSCHENQNQLSDIHDLTYSLYELQIQRCQESQLSPSKKAIQVLNCRVKNEKTISAAFDSIRNQVDSVRIPFSTYREDELVEIDNEKGFDSKPLNDQFDTENPLKTHVKHDK
eukprot:403344275